MTNGLYGYYDTKNKYVVYIEKDSDISKDKRHKAHKNLSNYNVQLINRVVQNNPYRYVYFKFIEGDYDEETLNELEQEAIRIFKTYKYDYLERNVFNFTRGGDGVGEGQDNPSWREADYKVIKNGIDNGKQTYGISGRYGNIIKTSINKERLEQLTNKLNNKKTTEKEVKNLQLHNTKEQTKNAIKSHIKYNIWNISCCEYYKSDMFRNNGGNKPRRCFMYKYRAHKLPIGMFNEFISPEIIDSIVQEEVKNAK